MLNVKIVLRTPAKPNLRSPLASDDPVTSAPPPVAPTATGGSTDPRVFLAQHARQKRMRARVRLAKRAALTVTAVAAGALLFSERPWQSGTATEDGRPPEPVALATAPSPDPALAAPGVTPEIATPPASAAAPAPGSPAAVEVSQAGPVPASSTIRARCDEAFAQRLWKAAVESCELAYAERPDATLALRLAHAYWGRGRVNTAGRWASRAVAEGSRDADAFVIVGHAERHAGRDQQAVRAYRRYLRASPQGWHARDVRAALRGLRARGTPQEVSVGSDPASTPNPTSTSASGPAAGAASSGGTQLVAR